MPDVFSVGTARAANGTIVKGAIPVGTRRLRADRARSRS